MDNNNRDELLSLKGWMVECESPLEVRHHDGSRASGQAARIVIDALLEECRVDAQHRAKLIEELQAVASDVALTIDDAVSKCAEKPEKTKFYWSRAYHRVFSPRVSDRVHDIAKELEQPFDYFDPDTAYKEDVRAFHAGLVKYISELRAL